MTTHINPSSTAEWYDWTIDWAARIAREIPVLKDLFGPPGQGGILDAGCGTGHQACALAALGYRVTGADASEEMLTIGRRVAEEAGMKVRHVCAEYVNFSRQVGSGFDGLYCIGNSLAAAASKTRAALAIEEFSKCLHTGGRILIQVLNFSKLRAEHPCVRGPRVARHSGMEIVTTRQFHFGVESAEVTNVSVWNDGGWKVRVQSRALYPMTIVELRDWFQRSGLKIEAEWGSYGREPFNPMESDDLLVVGSKCSR